MRRVDSERHQDGEDLQREDLVGAVAVGLVEVAPRLDVDAGLVERRLHVLAERDGVAVLQVVRLRAHGGQHVFGRGAHVGGNGEARGDAALEAGDAHHKELVEVAREDREEVGPLEQGERGVFGELEDTLVEREPAQFAVEVAVVGQRSVVDARRLVDVVLVERFAGSQCIDESVFAIHPAIIPLSRE